MKTTHLVASELLSVLVLAGCASLPPDQACRAGIEQETEVLNENGFQMQHHRSLDFPFFLSLAEGDELVGDYQSCVDNLKMARNHVHEYSGSGGSYYRSPNNYSGSRQSMGSSRMTNDAAHHAAGHTHHHGH